ncbi:outer membrane beta-barrel protein [Aliiglaciecola sp. CAU 1673]|uniref:OmpW/AlkL family protein n=1 Tax=Aliiglaciecola sp. CAU 1673 TaxID=3032595 RepID=UPI0023D9C8D8|nr:OmpW family outer membrane protein [Aliiglaciecola sp. CAU 1673]MDF2179028.1 outer membrane beta-barrel protein [Aliiglaciecola sp. CAU 1673]
MKKLTTLAALTAALLSSAAQANFHINVGAIHVAPNDGSSYLNVVETVAGLPQNSSRLAVDSNTQLGLTFDYDIDANWTIELIAATPFSHDISLNSTVGAVNGLAVGETKHLPPTLLAQYHFMGQDSAFRPFVGLGLNYTLFFSEDIDPALKNVLVATGAATTSDDVSLHLDDSFGLAAQAGFNYRINNTWGVHAMVMWADIDSDAEVRVNGTNVQAIDVKIDPLVAMIGARYRF